MTDKKAPAPTGIDLYARFAFAGAVCCSVTHAALTPVDVVKTRIQLDPQTYNKGMFGGFRQIVAKEGAGALLTGFAPTAAGYFVQGALKFGGYEFFKKQFVTRLGVEKATDNRTAIYLASSAMAEFFADVALCPLEATRIRLVSDPKFASSMPAAMARLLREQGVIKGFYSGFGPILFKQVPYTMAKFVVYERLAEFIYSVSPTPKEKMSNGMITAVNLGSGLGAGLVAAVISQPADTLLSKVNKQKGVEGQSITSRLVTLARELGAKGLFTGLGARLVMVGSLTAFQFAIYGDIKRVLNATGGTEIAAAKKAPAGGAPAAATPAAAPAAAPAKPAAAPASSSSSSTSSPHAPSNSPPPSPPHKPAAPAAAAPAPAAAAAHKSEAKPSSEHKEKK